MMDMRQYLLLKLGEECAEVAQRASKQSQFGGSEVQKNQDKTNKERLCDEICDLLCIVEMLRRINEVDRSAVPGPVEYQNKVDKIKRYYEYSLKLGLVE